MSTTVSEVSAMALLREGIARLGATDLAGAGRDAEWLLAGLLGVERGRLYVEPGRACSAGEALRYRAWLERRARHEPLQHLLGFEDFHGLRLRVTPDALIPRPETEGLVEWAAEILGGTSGAIVADIGTGSGAIACALARALPRIEVVGVDCSLAALEVASENLRRLGLAGRVRLLAGDLLEPLTALGARPDLIVSNPPYLPSPVLPTLSPEVTAFEPRVALDGGPDGMAVIRRIVGAAPAALHAGGWLLIEIGEAQAGPVTLLLAAAGFGDIEARRDLRDVERYIAGRLGEGFEHAGRGGA